MENRQANYLIGLDLGTSAIKAVLMSADGRIISREKEATEYEKAPGGVVQFDADKFYELTARVIRQLVSALPNGSIVAGISMASASGNTVLTDEAGKPLYPAISWQDQRVTDEMKQVFGELDPAQVHALVGWPLISSFPLAHLSWLKVHEPRLLESAAKVSMSTDYLNFRLTGRWGIDPSTATTFYLQDQQNSRWHAPYLRTLGISEEKLPPILPSGTVLGGITEQAAEETGLKAGTPVILGSFDHPCAARGSGVLREGQMLLSCGTSWVGFYPLKDRDTALQQNMLIDPFLRNEQLWGAMFSLSSAATQVDEYICRYLSDGPNRYAEFDRLAAAAPAGAGGLLIHPMVADKSVDTTRYSQAEIARAIMEGVAYLLKSRIEAMKEAGIQVSSITMVGGPSETYPWPQIVCDVLSMELSVVNGSCAGAAGAAILAGIGAGIFADEQDAFSKAAFARSIRVPDKEQSGIYRDCYQRFLCQH